MTKDEANAAADALCNAADELETLHAERETTDVPGSPVAKYERGQLLRDARWLRKRGVAIRAELNE
jgi:hypothetical protein